MTTTTTASVLGPRPAPEMIRFDDDCFEAAGERIEYVIGFAAPHYPERFDSREAAEARARKTGRTFSVERRTVYRRIKWN